MHLYFDCSDYFEDLWWTIHSKVRRLSHLRGVRRHFIHLSLWENMSACFLQLSARNIHLFIYYFDILQKGEGFDNIYKLKAYMFRVNGSKTLRDQVTTSCGFLLQYYFLRLFSVTNHKKEKHSKERTQDIKPLK